MVLIHFALSAIWFSYYDLKHHLIRRTHLGIALITLLPFISKAAIVFAVINGLLYLAIYLVTKGAMGFGDVTLAVLIGIYFGAFFSSFANLLLANWLSWCVASFVALIARLNGKHRHRIAFAPYMFLGLLPLFTLR